MPVSTPAKTSVETAPAKPALLRRALRWLAIGAGGLVLLLILTIAFVHTSWGKDVVRSRIEKALQKRVTGKLSIAGLDYGFLFSSVALKGVAIADANGDAAIDVGGLDVDLDRGSLLSGAPVLDRVVLSGVRVAIIKNADGTSNLTGLFVPSERKGRKIAVNELNVSDVAVRIERPDGSLSEIHSVGLAGRASIDTIAGNHRVELASLRGAATLTRPDGTVIDIPLIETAMTAVIDGEEIDVALDPLKATVQLTRADADPQSVELGLGRTSLEKRGKHIGFESGSVVLGPLTIGRIRADGELADRRLHGRQIVAIEGLRVSHAELAEVLGKPLLATDVSVDLRLEGPPESIAIEGLVATNGGNLAITGAIDAADLDQPAYDVEVTGSEIESNKILDAEIAKGRPSLASSLTIKVAGRGVPRRPGSKATFDVRAGPSRVVATGKVVNIDALVVSGSADGAAIDVEQLQLDAHGLRVAARASVSAARALTASVEVTGDPRRAVRELRAGGLAIRRLPVPLPRKLETQIGASGELDGSLNVVLSPTVVALAGGSVRIEGRGELVTIDGKRKLRAADADVRLTQLRIERLARIAGRRTALSGTLAGDVGVKMRGTARDISYDIRALIAEPEIELAARGELGAARATTTATVNSRALGKRVATIDATVPLRTRGGKRALNPKGQLKLDIEVDDRTVAELKTLVPARVATKIEQRATAGVLGATISLHGSPSAPRGTVAVRGTAALVALKGETAELALKASVSPSNDGGISIAIDQGQARVASIEGVLATISGGVSLGPLFRGAKLDRQGLRSSARLKAVTIEVPRRSLASLEPLRPALADLPGDVALVVRASGAPRTLEVEVDGGWTGYETVAGGSGAISVTATGTANNIRGAVAVGGQRQVNLDLTVSRDADRVSVSAVAKAERTKLAELLPKQAASHALEVDYGQLTWDMKTHVTLTRTDGAFALATVDMRGALDVNGATIAIPGSKRRYTDVEMRIEGEGDVIRLANLSARESDAQNDNRTVALSAEASLADGKPKRAVAKVRADQWLVFGGSMGGADAPQARVDADIDVDADLSGKIPVIDATINALDFRAPDRAIRDHGLESVSTFGDIVFVGETDVPVGKLGPIGGLVSPALPRKRTPMQLRLHIPKPVRVVKAPLDVSVSGDLEVAVKADGIEPVGVMTVHGGEVALFGHPHSYKSGTIAFNREHPKGLLTLVFARELPPATLRQLARHSGGTAVKLSIGGAVSKTKIGLSGAANAGMLEVMSGHNAGRALYFTEPDLHASNSSQAPRGLQPMVLTYLATNLPHLLVLDRFSAWSDPLDSRDAYGRVEHFVGERTSADSRSRVRIVSRPSELGRSTTEVQLDRLLINTASTALGAGVRAGSRLGGGVALFFEWTSSH